MRALPIRPDVQTATGSSYDGDGFLSVGVDGDAAVTTLPQVEALPPLGLMARPQDPGTDGQGDPLPGQSCTLLRLVGDNDDQAILLTDPRVVGLVPQLAKGGVALYEPTAANQDGTAVTDLARITLNDDGSHRILVHAPASSPPTKITIEIANGPHLTIDGTTSPPSLTLAIPGGPSIVLDATNFAQIGGPGGQPIAIASPAFLAWLTAVGAATHVGAPPAVAATKARAT